MYIIFNLKLVGLLGWEGERFLLICLIESLDLKESKEKCYSAVKG